jgi:WD40 repeat protein
VAWSVCPGFSWASFAAASDDRTARLWDVATGVRLGPLLVHSGPVLAAFQPKSQRIVTLAEDGPLRLWDVPPAVVGEPQAIKDWVEALTGKELTENGILREMDAEALQGLRETVRAHRSGPR